MTNAWLAGWIAPLVMFLTAIYASATRHRWSRSIWLGLCAGGGFCALAWLILRAALRHSDGTPEIVFLQVALSTAGLFVFGATAMLARKCQTK